MPPFTPALAALSPPETPTSTATSTASWIDRLRAGDADAFAELAQRERPRMLAVARRVLRVEADAEDAVQDALLAAYRALPYFQASARLSTWLHRIVVNAALMRLRAQRRRPESLLDDAGDGARPLELAAASDDASEQAETRTMVRDAIARLPEHYRRVIQLRDLQGHDTATTAAREGIGADALKMRLHRARAGLRALLRDEVAA